MRRVAKDNTLDYSRSTMLDLRNPKITDKITPVDEKTLATEHKQTWYTYYLDQAVNLYDVAVIVASTASEYLTEKKEMDYVGFAKEMAQSMFVFLWTQPAVLNKEKRQIRRNSCLPWSNSPIVTLEEFARNLNKRQQKAKKQEIIVENKDKRIHFVGCAQDLGLFEAEWVEN
jgi:hypothetical protein